MSYVMLLQAAMDALVHDEGDPWNVNPNVVKRVNNMLEGVSRCVCVCVVCEIVPFLSQDVS